MYSEQPWFIKFYAPWCGHCQALEPVWNEIFVNNHETLNMAKVDCADEINTELCIQFAIGGYPTLILLSGARYYDYDGRRDYESLVQFALGEGQQFLSAKDQGLIPKKVQPLKDSPNYVEGKELGMIDELLADIDLVFELNGMELVPSTMRYLLVA